MILSSSLYVIIATEIFIMEPNIRPSTFFQKAKCLLPGELYFIPDFLSAPKALRLYNQCVNEVSWKQTWITIYGKSHPVPRLVSWAGDKGVHYSYSGQKFCADGWPPGIKEVKPDIEGLLGVSFNSVLANYYEEGKHHMGWHSDNEPELGDQPVIASLSLGATRRFLYRAKLKSRESSSNKVDLHNGSLLVMTGDFQKVWQHRVSPTKRPVEGRINLTFRSVLKTP